LATATIESELVPFRVQFMCNNPVNQSEILLDGDVVLIPEAFLPMLTRQLADGLFVRLPANTPENRVQREEPSVVVGYNVSEREYEAQAALDALASKVPPGVIAEARESMRARK
jgi:hypothetical protein